MTNPLKQHAQTPARNTCRTGCLSPALCATAALTYSDKPEFYGNEFQ